MTMRETLTPTNRAPCRFTATARMALPTMVWLKKSVKPSTIAAANPITQNC